MISQTILTAAMALQMVALQPPGLQGAGTANAAIIVDSHPVQLEYLHCVDQPGVRWFEDGSPEGCQEHPGAYDPTWNPADPNVIIIDPSHGVSIVYAYGSWHTSES